MYKADIVYSAPPTCARFMKSEAFFRLIAGPVGSGKTTACLFELFRRACEQHPAPDGYRYTRFAIVRQTLKQLRDTVLKDITSWLEGMAQYKVSESTVFVRIGDVRSEWILIPLDNPEDQRRLLSMQLTGAWMSEAIEMDLALTDPLSGRCGRYPGPKLGGCTWKGIIADTNMPAEGSDWHNFMELNTPPDTQIFIQPGGLSDEAENLQWLNQNPETLKLAENDPIRIAEGRKYYERLGTPGPTRSEDWIRRYVHAKYGNDPSGTAVYRETFKKHWHTVPELEPVHGHPLLIGQDFGRDPWSIIGQVDHKGRLLILEEVEAEDIGLELHIQKSLRPCLMQDRYFGRPIALIGDPAGVAKDSHTEESSFDLLKRYGFMAVPGSTNDIDPRIRAVESWLLQSRDAGPAILFDSTRCPKLVAAMSGGYRYAKTKEGRRKPLPDKNEYSHPSDALQYLCLGAGGMQGLIFRRLFITPKRTPLAVPAAAWT